MFFLTGKQLFSRIVWNVRLTICRFDDCLKLGQRIDEMPYLLAESAEPEILGAMRKSTKECVKELDPTHLEGASTALPNPRQLPTPSMSPNSSIRKTSVFKNKHVMLSYDLDISSHLRKTLDELIVAAGGTLTGSIHKADTYICQYREGNDYMTAYENTREIGNLAWLYYLITHGTWTSPLRRLLHYPIAREGLQDFKDFKICLSNFNGDARIYLENLARAIGSEFTKTMTQENTHLITAHTVSEKCQAAREWGVNVVNHLWLEESYAKWQAQTLTNPRYTHFPARTNLSQVVGQTPIDKKALPKSFKMGEGAEDRQTPKPLPRTNKLSAKLPTSSGQRPTQSSPTRQAGALQSLGPDVGTPQVFKEKRRHSDSNGLKTPASRGLTGKENETPSTTPSRKAKEIAVTKVQDAANDMNAYQKETRRVGGVTHGGRRSADEIVNDPNPSRKRTKSAEDERGAEPAKEERATKKAKNSKGPPTIHLLLSGYQKWVDNPKQEGVDRVSIRNDLHVAG